MSDLLFNKVKHEYSHDGIILPGVTLILESGGLKEPYASISGTTGKGTRIHHYSEYMDQDDLDWSVVSDTDKPYVEAYADFKAKTGFKPRLIESPQHSHQYGYATVIDREGDLDGVPTLLEIKTFPKQRWWGVQLKGQQLTMPMMEVGVYALYALELRKSGRWKLHDFGQNIDDYDAFKACLQIYKWRNK